MDLQYEGTGYHGFGLQAGRLTIQEVLEEALASILGQRVRVTVAGRTDAGVHASGQVVSFQAGTRLGPPELVRALNAYLPQDVVVDRAAEMPPHFDARRSALRRHYRYRIWNRPQRDLWRRRWSWHVPTPLDWTAMDAAATLLVGRGDFAAFAGQAAREPAGRSTVRTVERAVWRQDGGSLTFDISADAFLRQMVRGIVGTLIWVGRGRLAPAEIEAIVASRDRRRAGPNAPPEGLMLAGVDYPVEYEADRDDPEALETIGDDTLLAAPLGEGR